MGFDGKTLVHPSQVEPANAAWSPTADEIELAERIIEAYTAAEAEGRGVVTVDGRMVEHLHVENARRTLALAEAIADSVPDANGQQRPAGPSGKRPAWPAGTQ